MLEEMRNKLEQTAQPPPKGWKKHVRKRKRVGNFPVTTSPRNLRQRHPFATFQEDGVVYPKRVLRRMYHKQLAEQTRISNGSTATS